MKLLFILFFLMSCADSDFKACNPEDFIDKKIFKTYTQVTFFSPYRSYLCEEVTLAGWGTNCIRLKGFYTRNDSCLVEAPKKISQLVFTYVKLYEVSKPEGK